jgi:hypothetical protein
MIVGWNPLVNNDFILDGDYHLEEGYAVETEFESGKKSDYLKNSYVPMIYSSVGLELDNTVPTESGNTEYQEFMKWFLGDLRYGILPFYAPRIGFKKKYFTKTGEIGIYKFIPNSLKWDRIEGVSLASFGLEERGFLPEIKWRLLGAGSRKILLANKGAYIVTPEGS